MAHHFLTEEAVTQAIREEMERQVKDSAGRRCWEKGRCF